MDRTQHKLMRTEKDVWDWIVGYGFFFTFLFLICGTVWCLAHIFV
jgi:hypothetical protein